MGRLNEKIVAITGGGSGIGYSASKMFAKEGATVLILEINEENAVKTKAEIESEGGKAAVYPIDVSNEEAVKETFEKIDLEFGGLDVLYNNASVFWSEGEKRDNAVDVLDMKVFERIMKINLFGLVYCSKYAIPLLKKRGGGSIINTGSSAAVYGVTECDSYTASKGATVALTRSMAVEYGPFNIRTNCICPAGIATPMLVESNLKNPNFDPDKFCEKGTPLKRFGKPEEIAGTAIFLASEDGGYLNGAILVADGGITIMHHTNTN